MDEEVLVDIKPVKLSKPALLAIAQIVRASADLEDVINLWICKLTKLSQSKATVILGRSNISTKLEIAEALANICGEIELHKIIFDQNMANLLRCRNAVAHGHYIGKAKSGWIFSTSVTLGYEGDQVAKRAEAYSTRTLATVASVSAGRIALMDDILGLKPLRDKRQTQRLPEYQPGRKRKKASSKRKPPRKASQG
jgi:hypothetical protein